ncbi:hypothetical protein APHAL10511_004761 [Amanita phalloides]|nr:hypothetical protein APHAL10511_004761 [Amanita phalloides]
MVIKPLTIALVYELRSAYLERGYSINECAELATETTRDNISSGLEKLGHRVIHVPDIKCLVQQLAAGKEKERDLVFNYSEGVHGIAKNIPVPGLLKHIRSLHVSRPGYERRYALIRVKPRS